MDGVAQTIVSVGQLAGHEFWLLRAVGSEVAELRDELATMNSLLRIYSEAEPGAVDHFVREWMKQLRELTYDAEDCIDLYIFRIKCGTGYGLLGWSKRMVATIFPRHLLAGKIKDLRLRAIAISDRHARYDAVNRETLLPSPSLAPVATASAQAPGLSPANQSDRLVGIGSQANALAERVVLMKNDQEEKTKKVFSIVGFGGLGKTTLAREVCRLLEPAFDCQALVSVSQAFNPNKDLNKLLQRIIDQIVKPKERENISKEEGGPSIDGLKEFLEQKRYLIVIDDVWTMAAWDAIRSKLPIGKHGSRIIVTTRIKTVAEKCSNISATEDCIHHMEALKDEDSKELFLNRAFGSSMDMSSRGIELEDIINKILKKCAGLPLAIISIACLLAGYKYPERKDMWETIWKSIGSQMESNPTLEGMSEILTLSYNHLPYRLKGCMMYLSIFPEDFEIPRDRLLHRWIAEGLVQEKRGLTLLEVADGYFEELLSRSMIEPLSSTSHVLKVNACRVHDMMLEVMVSKSLEANFISLLGGQYEGMSYERIRRLSIHGGANNNSASMNGGASRKHGKREVEVQHVRSLSVFDPQEKKMLERLDQFTLLRVLDLENCKGLENKHVKDICEMYLLRFLSMKGTDITKLPKKVGQLEHLQVFDVTGTCIKKLPKTIARLQKLEHLGFSQRGNWETMWQPTAGLRKMKVLRHLSGIHIMDVDAAKELGELADLQGVTVFVDEPCERTEPILKELVESLSKLYSLQFLGIGCFGERNINFIDAMVSPPMLIESIYLDGQINKIPDWVLSLHNLIHVQLNWSQFFDDNLLYGALCKLPNLKNLGILEYAFFGGELVAHAEHKFPVLRGLSVSCEEPLKVIQFEDGAMDMLESLSLGFGFHERRIVGIQHLKNLKWVSLSCNSNNKPAVDDALEQLKRENKRRLESSQLQFTVGVRYN